MKSCGTCQKFKGSGQYCGQTYAMHNGGTAKYHPMSEKVGPCMEGYVEKKELIPLSVPSEEHSILKERHCSDCQKYKGPNVKCGESIVSYDGERIYYSPYGDYAIACGNDKFVPKKDNKDFAVKARIDGDSIVVDMGVRPYQKVIVDEVHSFKIPDTRVLVAKQQGLGISREMQEELNKITTSKETSNMNAIIRLADSQLNKQIEDFGGLSLDIREALETMQAEEKKQAAATAAREVMTLLKSGQSVIEYEVSNINDARRQERAAKDRIEAINRAIAYGKETSNFVPLAILTGHLYAQNIDNAELRTVPKDWAPKPAEGQPVAAA